MRDNFNVHEWRIDQIRQENISEQLDDEKAVQAIATAVADFADIKNDKFLQGTIRTALGSAYLNEGLDEDKADAVRWFGNLKYYFNKAFAELKGEDRETYKQLAKDFFSKLEIDQHIRPVGLGEGWNDGIDKVTLMYTNYGDLYKVKIDGKVVDPSTIEDIVGIKVPTEGYYHSDDVIAIVDALKRKGIDADSTEIDVG